MSDDAGKWLRQSEAPSPTPLMSAPQPSQHQITHILESPQDSDFFLPLALEAGELGWFDYRPVTGELIHDRTCALIWGLEPDERKGMDFLWSSLLPEDVDATQMALASALDPNQTNRFLTEYRIRPLGKSEIRWIRATGRTIFEGEGAGRHAVRLVGTLQDITERKQAEEKIRHQNAVLEGINRILREAMECVNEAELGRVCLAVAQELTGSKFGFIAKLSPEGRLEEIATSVLDPDYELMIKKTGHRMDVADVKSGGIFDRVLRGGEPLLTNDPASYPGVSGLPDGHLPLRAFLGVPLLLQGDRISEMIGLGNREGGYRKQDLETLKALAQTIVQVFLRQRAEQALRESEERKVEEILASERELLNVTIHSLGEGVIATDRQERIILFNKAAAALTGYSTAEAFGEPLAQIFKICNDQTGEPMEAAAIQEGSCKPLLITRDHRKIPVSINISPIKTSDGLIIGTVTVFWDISVKQKNEQHLLRAEKLESLGILAGGIAHDFNNILAAILGNIQLAVLKLEKNQDIKPYLLKTVETTRRASDLTKQLLTFSRGGAPVKKDASLNELIKETAEFVLRGATTRAEFTIPDDLWPVNIDVSQICQVIHNLIINAKQAMPGGGIIQVGAENIMNQGMNPGRYVKISVQDQGAGIPRENLSKIFDPFFTTKQDGNGLGLTTSYSIISRHNGYIEVESQEGAGSTFFVYLPASDQAVVQTESHPEVKIRGSGSKILIMEDEKTIRSAVSEMLEHYGYLVASTKDGAETITVYKEAMAEGQPFDVVIMDLTIPGGMGGQETISHLRELDPKIKAIVSSGYANDPIMADYEMYGFVGVVSKPYKIDELLEVIQRVVHPG